MEKITPRQNEILEYIYEELNKNQTAPSILEIAKKFGIKNPNGVRNHILALEKKGYITRIADKARSIQIKTPPPKQTTKVITRIKKKRWTKKKYFYHVPIFISILTRKGYQFFNGSYANELEKKIKTIAENHGWDIMEINIKPDGFTIGLITSPDHSVERVVNNLKNQTLPIALKHPMHFHGKKIWATGFAAATDNLLLKELVIQHKKTIKKKEE